MNFIAGYLIIITKDEEKSFWLMDALLANMLPGNFLFFSVLKAGITLGHHKRTYQKVREELTYM